MIGFEHKGSSETVLILVKVYMYVSTSFPLYVCHILNFLCLFKKRKEIFTWPWAGSSPSALAQFCSSSWEAALQDLVRGLYIALSSEVAPPGLP